MDSFTYADLFTYRNSLTNGFIYMWKFGHIPRFILISGFIQTHQLVHIRRFIHMHITHSHAQIHSCSLFHSHTRIYSCRPTLTGSHTQTFVHIRGKADEDTKRDRGRRQTHYDFENKHKQVPLRGPGSLDAVPGCLDQYYLPGDQLHSLQRLILARITERREEVCTRAP